MRRLKKALAFTLTLLLVTSVFGGALTQTACSDKDIQITLDEVSDGAQRLVTLAGSTVPKLDEASIVKLRQFASLTANLARDFASAVTPTEKLTLVSTLRLATNLFESDVMPLLKLSAVVQLVVYGLDSGLRIASRYFVKTAAKVVTTTNKVIAAAAGVNVSSTVTDIDALKDFLQTPKVAKPKQ